MQTIRYIKYRRRRRRAIRRLTALFLFILILIGLVFTAKSFLTYKPSSQEVKSASDDTDFISEELPSHPPPIEKSNSKLLGDAVQSALQGTQGSYGILVENLKTKEFYSTNEHTTFYSASLYKLWVMMTAFDQIAKGELSKDTLLTQDIRVLNKKFNIASESAEQTEGTIKMTVGDALEKMIVISDNYSALLLTEKVKLSAVDSMLKKHGLYESQIGKNGKLPITTPYDMGLFFEKLYHGKLGNKQSSDEMIALLKSQRLNDKIPRYLPDDVVVAHKTGELDEYTHDAAIIYSPEFDYILIVLSKSNAPDLAEVRIANISQEVFSYFSRN